MFAIKWIWIVVLVVVVANMSHLVVQQKQSRQIKANSSTDMNSDFWRNFFKELSIATCMVPHLDQISDCYSQYDSVINRKQDPVDEEETREYCCMIYGYQKCIERIISGYCGSKENVKQITQSFTSKFNEMVSVNCEAYKGFYPCLDNTMKAGFIILVILACCAILYCLISCCKRRENAKKCESKTGQKKSNKKQSSNEHVSREQASKERVGRKPSNKRNWTIWKPMKCFSYLSNTFIQILFCNYCITLFSWTKHTGYGKRIVFFRTESVDFFSHCSFLLVCCFMQCPVVKCITSQIKLASDTNSPTINTMKKLNSRLTLNEVELGKYRLSSIWSDLYSIVFHWFIMPASCNVATL